MARGRAKRPAFRGAAPHYRDRRRSVAALDQAASQPLHAAPDTDFNGPIVPHARTPEQPTADRVDDIDPPIPLTRLVAGTSGPYSMARR